MRIDHLCQVVFTWQELKHVLADQIEMEANDQVAGSPRNLQLLELAAKARSEHTYVEPENQDGVALVIDGVAYAEEL